MHPDVSIAVMWNPSAGSAGQAEHIRQRLLEMPRVKVCESGGRDEMLREVGECCNSPVDILVAAGGDGTVSSVIEGLMGMNRRPTLGILPLGTGNDFARSLGIPIRPDDAVDFLLSENIREIDVVRYTTSDHSNWYANMLTGGNTGRYMEHMTEEIKQRWGPFCYLRGVLDVIQDLQVYHIEVSCDDGPAEQFDALNVFVANGRMSGGGMIVSPVAEQDDGKVDLIMVRDGDAGEIAGLTMGYVAADYLGHELVEFRRAQRLRIQSDPPLPLTADGERIGETPLTIEVIERSVRVIAPVG